MDKTRKEGGEILFNEGKRKKKKKKEKEKEKEKVKM